jgi:hypothetical protein
MYGPNSVGKLFLIAKIYLKKEKEKEKAKTELIFLS